MRVIKPGTDTCSVQVINTIATNYVKTVADVKNHVWNMEGYATLTVQCHGRR